jgi:hypothetical protein
MLLRRPRNPLPPVGEQPAEPVGEQPAEPVEQPAEPVESGLAAEGLPGDARGGEVPVASPGESKATPADPATRHTIEAD